MTTVTVTDRSALAQVLRQLKLSGMLATLDARLTQAAAGDLGHLDFLQVLCEDEISRRSGAAIGRRLRRARFDEQSTFEGFDFTASPGRLALLDADGAAVMASTGLLLDARAGERYRGETELVDPVAGHIPGAVSAPTADNVYSDGTFRAAADLAARFTALGAPPPPDPRGPPAPPAMAPAVGVYCGSGVTAAHEVLALAIAGIPAALYVGSWSNWITDPARPVAAGP